MKKEKLKNKGITLIALIITIIVMLILVAVTISVALNGGLISKAQEAKTKTEEAQIQERDLLSGRIKIGDTWYDSLDEYLKNNPSENQSDEPPKWGEGENVGKLATEVLKVDPDAEEEEKQGPYVKYNNLLWKTLYDSNSGYGLQLVSTVAVDTITVGPDDDTVTAQDFQCEGAEAVPEEVLHAIASFNHLPEHYNQKLHDAVDCGEGKLAENIRLLGTLPDFSPIDTSNFVTVPEGYKGGPLFLDGKILDMPILKDNGTFTDIDSSDRDAMLSCGYFDYTFDLTLLYPVSQGFFDKSLTAGYTNNWPGSPGFGGRTFEFGMYAGPTNLSKIFGVATSDGSWTRTSSKTYDLVGVILINDSAVIMNGQGTKDDPYILYLQS